MTNKLGRPTLSENEKTTNLSVSVTEVQAKFLKEYGFGNVSLGIRRLVDGKRDHPCELQGCRFWIDHQCTDMSQCPLYTEEPD